MHKVGDRVWVFDSNRIVRDSHGVSIFREHFRPIRIDDETTRSWRLANGLLVPKTGDSVRTCGGGPYGKTLVYMTREAVDDAVFRDTHQHRLAEAVNRCSDVDALRKVAELVGYKVDE